MLNPIYIEEYLLVKKEYYKELAKLTPEYKLKNINGFKEKAKWAWSNIEPKLHISFGNAKLPKSTCIINLGTWFNCPGRRNGFCELKEKCYDKQPEVRFKERTKDRLEHEIFWRTVDAETFSNAVIKEIKRKRKNNINLIRWSEVGDIRNQEDLNKIIECSNIIYNTLGINSYIYTHNKDLNFDISRPHLTINGSNFMVDNEYKIFKKEEPHGIYSLFDTFNCKCDCTQCNTCSKKNNTIILETLR